MGKGIHYTTSGFGLFELFLGIALTSVLSVGAYQMLSSSSRSVNRDIVGTNLSKHIHRSLDRLRKDVETSGSNPTFDDSIFLGDVKYRFGFNPKVSDPHSLFFLYTYRSRVLTPYGSYQEDLTHPWGTLENENVEYKFVDYQKDGLINDLIRIDFKNPTQPKRELVIPNVESVKIRYFNDIGDELVDVHWTSKGKIWNSPPTFEVEEVRSMEALFSYRLTRSGEVINNVIRMRKWVS